MLSFTNGYSQVLSVAIMWYHPNCPDGGDWEKKGWWNINPGNTAHVLDLDLDETNRYYYFYAEAVDGHTWSGPYFTNVPSEAFDWCENTGSTTSRSLGFRELDIGDNDDYTLTLVQ
jgi:uncharacterized membrane protein